MNVAHRLARLRERTAEQWLRAGNAVVAPTVAVILLIVLAWRLADLTWSLIPGERTGDAFPEVAAVVPATSVADPIPPVALEALTESHLFGEPLATAAEGGAREAAATVVGSVDAPDTPLSLELTGVVARRGEGTPGQAIIVTPGREQKVYGVGDMIDGANGATLHAVLADRVLLNRSGQLESLRLPREHAGQARPAGAVARPALRSPFGGGAPANPTTLSQVIGANASRISDIIQIAPAIDQGRILGFRINPGADAVAFAALGLEPGDIVTEVNGTVIDDPNRGLQVFEALGETTMANVTLLRDGTPRAVVIDTTQLQQIAE